MLGYGLVGCLPHCFFVHTITSNPGFASRLLDLHVSAREFHWKEEEPSQQDLSWFWARSALLGTLLRQHLKPESRHLLTLVHVLIAMHQFRVANAI